MTYAIVNTKSLKVVQVSRNREDLQQKAGTTEVNTRDLTGFKRAQLVMLYNGLTGEKRKGFSSLDAARQAVAAAIEARAKAEAGAKEEPGPVARVWAIAEHMRGQRRRDVIAACVAEGINEFTARTQYQRWYASQHH